MKRFILCFSAFLAIGTAALADEGMWMCNDLCKKQASLCGAIVSYDFMGTGSLVSDQGLVITNHHVVYSDVYSLSTPDKNLLAEGFWAYRIEDELPIPGRSVQILAQTIDVTDEVMQAIAEGKAKEGPMMMRRLGTIFEKKYEEKTGKMAILSSMWKGSRYYIDLYDEYKDVRLVAAPPEIIGAFGGDEDNWEWPQQKGDFSFVRIYTAPDGSPAEYSPENIPLKSVNHLTVSSKGIREGAKTMVMGFPGRTNRYAGAAQVDWQTNVSLPVTVRIRGAQMEILRKWMNADETVRLKYADHFFGLSNAQELYLGQVACNKRFNVVDEKKAIEKELQQWILADAQRKARWGSLISDLDRAYSAVSDIDIQLGYFRECMARSSRLSAIASRTASLRRLAKADSGNAESRGAGNDKDAKHSGRDEGVKLSGRDEGVKHSGRDEGVKRSGRIDYEAMDLRAEREIFRYVLEEYLEHVDDSLLGPFQRECKERFTKTREECCAKTCRNHASTAACYCDYDALCSYLWDGSWMTTPSEIERYLAEDSDLVAGLDYLLNDNLCRFYNDAKITQFNEAKDKTLGGLNLWTLNTEYARALYQMRLEKKIKQYPDANSTLRVSYGKVCGYSPRDAVSCSWKSTVAGLLEKNDPAKHDFNLPESWSTALSSNAKGDMTVNFITDNDITGGNSGSPVMNSRGQVVGLAFDGNKESLASDVSFTPDYNRCICVDIRFVLWTLEHYAHFDRLLDEIDIR